MIILRGIIKDGERLESFPQMGDSERERERNGERERVKESKRQCVCVDY